MVQRFATVLLVDPRGWLLLQERDEHPVIGPDQWGLVGGHVEPGEEIEPAAYRELEEETGIVLPPGALTLWGDVPTSHPSYGEGRMWVYAARTELTDADIVLGEGRRIVFVAPTATSGLDLTDAARDVLPAFLVSETYVTMTR